MDAELDGSMRNKVGRNNKDRRKEIERKKKKRGDVKPEGRIKQ